jgi:hypothetical protein
MANQINHERGTIEITDSDGITHDVPLDNIHGNYVFRVEDKNGEWVSIQHFGWLEEIIRNHGYRSDGRKFYRVSVRATIGAMRYGAICNTTIEFEL